MKIALIFLVIFVAISHQQYIHRMFWRLPYQSNFIPQSVYYNNFLNSRRVDSLSRYIRPIIILFSSGGTKSRTESSYIPEENKYPDIQPRFKSSSKSSDQKSNPRFLWSLFGLTATSSFGNFLLKTVTLTISSTCTALSFVTCVPRVNINPAAPAAFVTCGRKREINRPMDKVIANDDGQFPIIPSHVQGVEPTTPPWPVLSRNPRQTSFKIVSSQGEGAFNQEDEFQELLLRKKRFYYLWQSFATAITVTSWSVISSVTTSTLIPRDVLGQVSNLPCLPAGFTTCAQAGK